MPPHQGLSLVAGVLLGLSPGVRDAHAPSTKPEPGDMSELAAGLALSSMAVRWGEAAAAGRGSEALRSNRPEGAGFADWVISTDPERWYLFDAFVRDNRILGVIVNPHLTRGQVQHILTSLLSGMQHTFPGRPLEVLAYYRNGDQLARLTWNPQTRQAHTVWRH